MLTDNNLTNILNIYEKEISKNVKNKRKIYNFEINKMQNIGNIIDMLNQGKVGHNKYNIFLIYEPKVRLVMSLSVKDKIINHFITRYVLEKKLTKYLDMRNCATRKNMGCDYAIKLVKKYIEINKRKNKNFYVLKLDIKKYFYNIDHDVLKKLLINDLTTYEYELICKIIDSTNFPYINNIIEKYKEKYHVDIPLYEYNKGLPIGNMTSQFLSIYYLNRLDHYIVHDLKCKYYVRYMDDFIIIDEDKEKLNNVKKIITEKLKKEYLLDIHEKKTFITNIKQGFSFLGYNYKVINNKTIMKINNRNYEKIKRRIKKQRNELKRNKINYNQAFCSIMTYLYSYKYADNKRIYSLVDRYFYNEK